MPEAAAAVNNAVQMESDWHASPPEEAQVVSKGADPKLRPWNRDSLYRTEFVMLRCIQGALPYRCFAPVALLIHNLGSAGLMVPLLGILTWAVSLPAAASTTACAAYGVALNCVVKWAFQRPRPLWLDTGEESGVTNCGSVWESDYSFPSGHTQFFSSLLIAAWFAFDLDVAVLAVFILLGPLVGLSRNYLGVHFCSDTLVGWMLGCLTALVWIAADPYGTLLRQGDPVLSVATAVALGLVLVLLAAGVRCLVPSVEETLRAEWLATGVQGLLLQSQSKHKLSAVGPQCIAAEADCGAPEKDDVEKEIQSAKGDVEEVSDPEPRRCARCQKKRKIRARSMELAVGPAAAGLVALGASGFYPMILPQTALNNCLAAKPPFSILLLRVAVGLAGLLLLLLLSLPIKFAVRMPSEPTCSDTHAAQVREWWRSMAKCYFTVHILVVATLWSFVFSHMVFEQLGLSCEGH
eukprot:TRINITY_DN6063_c0_g2_i1.p1 TRINITY_DN6063_c0_g2~~TRINITY_DN6063_c0_g2_i1.p1  ORF type:complete len:465 (+),score=80.94 TRINITY_DN6063_c0_g2_i1:54-1448(+)